MFNIINFLHLIDEIHHSSEKFRVFWNFSEPLRKFNNFLTLSSCGFRFFYLDLYVSIWQRRNHIKSS